MTLFKKKSLLTPQLYEEIYNDVKIWCVNELAQVPPQMVDGVQVNALLNFIMFDMTTLMTEAGFVQMRRLLSGTDTEQTVMIRIKGLVVDLYIKYGDDIIDELRERTYKALQNTYGLTFDLENQLDVNNTLWLHPFARRMYTELPSA